MLVFGAGLVRIGGDPYQHHGQQQHFMPVRFDEREWSAILWDPDCESIEGAACTAMLEKIRRGDMPARDGLLAQLINYTDHMMIASYIPCAWATLRRWQQTLENASSVVTEREFRVVEDALATLNEKLNEYARKVRHNEGPRGATKNESAAMSALHREQDRLLRTRERLQTVRYRRLTLMDVYGSAAQLPEFTGSVERWAKHAENRSSVQYAMIPRQPDDGFLLAREPLDIDSIC
jgi:hypothetical protein